MEVRLSQPSNQIVLVVRDDGRGIGEFDLGHLTSLGLLGIQERVAKLGGAFNIAGNGQTGTAATVRIPVSSNGGAQG